MDDDDNHENDNDDRVQNEPTPLKEDSIISYLFLDLFERFKTKILKNVWIISVDRVRSWWNLGIYMATNFNVLVSPRDLF